MGLENLYLATAIVQSTFVSASCHLVQHRQLCKKLNDEKTISFNGIYTTVYTQSNFLEHIFIFENDIVLRSLLNIHFSFSCQDFCNDDINTDKMTKLKELMVFGVKRSLETSSDCENHKTITMTMT